MQNIWEIYLAIYAIDGNMYTFNVIIIIIIIITTITLIKLKMFCSKLWFCL